MGAKRDNALLKSKDESYKHVAAKMVLQLWLADDFEVRTERELFVDGWKFIPDIITYRDGHIQAFYEVVHRHPIHAKKLGRMQHYCWANNLEILVHEVDAEWVLRQIAKPERILSFTFDLNMSKYLVENQDATILEFNYIPQ